MTGHSPREPGLASYRLNCLLPPVPQQYHWW